ncbi:MAG: hypothetical protein A4E27_01184 [Methanobacterium sp. PtaU1.Bin242]|nr:MAG: hypothetical protein A4E27_01184 [Methanobacterium sp. PtaU1.Bin242]
MLIQALDEQGTEGSQRDACDVIWRNNAAISFDIQKELFKITAETLVIGIEGDQFFPPDIDAIPLSESIKNSQLFIYQSDLGHLGINEIYKMKDVISNFLSNISSE